MDGWIGERWIEGCTDAWVAAMTDGLIDNGAMADGWLDGWMTESMSGWVTTWLTGKVAGGMDRSLHSRLVGLMDDGWFDGLVA